MLIRFSPLAIAEFPNPRAAAARINSPFRAQWNRTLKLLDYELECLAAEDILIRAGFNAGSRKVPAYCCRTGGRTIKSVEIRRLFAVR
jgi:hypothetical protein